MNIKRIWLVLPAVFMPYITIGTLVLILFSAEDSTLSFIMEKVFYNNGLYLLAVVVAYAIIASILTGICFILSIIKKWNALSLAKTAMIIKIIQSPAYIMIYIFGISFMVAIFTAPIAFILCVLDYLALMMTGALSISAVIVAVRQRDITLKENIWAVLLQFVFCADVVASIVFYIKLRAKTKNSLQVKKEA